ncbi:hypothetical protein HDK90DRAFT_480677 [Phyllosticta capitalensis]|uniref:Secreted protein n=1 Tax=Phyllosticta capitalensis TaxID=121624 RepID=A0ABR1YX37_9PEZI
MECHRIRHCLTFLPRWLLLLFSAPKHTNLPYVCVYCTYETSQPCCDSFLLPSFYSSSVLSFTHITPTHPVGKLIDSLVFLSRVRTYIRMASQPASQPTTTMSQPVDQPNRASPSLYWSDSHRRAGLV